MKRMIEMVGAPFPTPGGYPQVGEQAVLDRLGADADRKLAARGVIAHDQATRGTTSGDDEDHGIMFDGPGDLGDSYLD